MAVWHLITGEYPPQPGGVSDYSRLVACGLAGAGDEVHVWAPECTAQLQSDDGVVVHRLPGHFGPRALTARARSIDSPGQSRMLVARSAERIFVATPLWEDLLRRFIGPHNSISWLPVPSNIPVVANSAGVAGTPLASSPLGSP